MEKNKSHYINEDGNRVAHASYLANRGTCCKTGCLHCPYGTSLRMYGIKFHDIEESNYDKVIDLFKDLIIGEFDVTKALLEGAYGKKEIFPMVSPSTFNEFRLMTLKDVPCGIVHLNENNKITNYLLREEFREQGLTRTAIEAQYVQSFSIS